MKPPFVTFQKKTLLENLFIMNKRQPLSISTKDPKMIDKAIRVIKIYVLTKLRKELFEKEKN